MSMWSAIVLIVAILAITQMVRARHSGKSSHDSDALRAKDRELEERREEIAELRERVQVLERIATDGREAKRISDEIESLKDQ